MAVAAALEALDKLSAEALEPKALYAQPLELDELTRARCTICAGAIAAKILVARNRQMPWDRESEAKTTLERLERQGRLFLWGESAVPFFLLLVSAFDKLRSDPFSDRVLLSVLSNLASQNSRFESVKLPPPYDSADDAMAKLLGRALKGEKQLELQASLSYSIESLVILAVRRMLRCTLASMWAQVSKVSLVQLVPDHPRDLLLWDWGEERGENRSRLFGAPQSWRSLSEQSWADQPNDLPQVLRTNLDFSVLFFLSHPHRVTPAIVKFLDSQ